MTLRANDLTTVFMPPDPGAAQPVSYRQGVIVEWDTETAENVVEVSGSTLTNLPILNTSEALLLEPGAVVGILSAGSAWMILGRLTKPGTPEAASALRMVTSRIQAAQDPGLGTRSSSTYGDLTGAAVGPAVPIRVSSSGRALVFWSCDHGETTNWENNIRDGVSVAVSGATTVAASPSFAIGHYLQMPVAPAVGAGLFSFGNQSAGMHLFTDLNAGVNVFTLKYRSVFGQAIRFQEREIAVFAL